MAMSPYIRWLRERVGGARLLVASVCVLVWDVDGRLLLVRDSDSGLFTTVGGAIEPDESPLEAALREAREEIGVEVTIDRLRGAFGGPAFSHTYSNGDEVGFVPVVYDAHILRGDPCPDGEETVEVRWFALTELGDELTPLTRVLLRATGIDAVER